MFFVVAGSVISKDTNIKSIDVFDTSDNSIENVSSSFITDAIKTHGVKIEGIDISGGYESDCKYIPQTTTIKGTSRIYVDGNYTLVIYCEVSETSYILKFILFYKGCIEITSRRILREQYIKGIDSITLTLLNSKQFKNNSKTIDYLSYIFYISNAHTNKSVGYCSMLYKNNITTKSSRSIERTCNLIPQFSKIDDGLTVYSFDNQRDRLLKRDTRVSPITEVNDSEFI